jgi:hypothetical protein
VYFLKETIATKNILSFFLTRKDLKRRVNAAYKKISQKLQQVLENHEEPGMNRVREIKMKDIRNTYLEL